ncbi:MAG: DNA phosphorothioation system sulfurtransferase DndC [Rhodobacteraceae bacterium]|nr:DNA phosphorothioation system sulfurtransferase DndC [Paracoccaceae bacterium]
MPFEGEFSNNSYDIPIDNNLSKSNEIWKQSYFDNPNIPDSDNNLFHIRQEVRDEYAEPHEKPWIIGYSGGKDSTLVLHLVIEHLVSLPRSERVRPIHVVANDTLVESPLVMAHVKSVLNEIKKAVLAFDLPIIVNITSPDIDQTFWVNLIGRGYPTPNRNFRWCTDRMKIRPTSTYIREQAKISGEVILLLGVRRNESRARATTAARYDNGSRLNQHNSLPGCNVFRPILELETEDVWEFLALNKPPWGGSHQRLIQLYREAGGGECPVVTSLQDAPSCGTTSSRFGCWTCTVVEKDKSLTGFVDSGFEQFLPLLNFRDWLIEIRNDPERRLARRRNGQVTITNKGIFVPGPFNMSTRHEILDRLLELQTQSKMDLIKQTEIDRIRELWIEDVIVSAERNLKVQRSLGAEVNHAKR